MCNLLVVSDYKSNDFFVNGENKAQNYPINVCFVLLLSVMCLCVERRNPTCSRRRGTTLFFLKPTKIFTNRTIHILLNNCHSYFLTVDDCQVSFSS